MEAEILLNIAKHLEKLPAKKFSLAEWTCGTSACAVGHAIKAKLIPCLKLRTASGHDYLITTPYHISTDNTGFRAVECALDLTPNEAEWLFSKEQYPRGNKTTPKTVTRRIRKFVSKGGFHGV